MNTQLGMLDSLPDVERTALVRCARAVRFPKDSYLFHAQTPGESLYVIATGRVGIWSGGVEGRPTLVATRGPGDFVGELAVLGKEQVRGASVQALTTVTATQFDRRDILAVLERRPRAYMLFIDLLIERLQRLTEQLAEFVDLDGTTRVYRQLCALADLGSGSSRSTTIPLAQHHIASLAGVSLRLASDVLTTARQDGLLTTGRGEITVFDWPAVRRRAGLARRR